MGQSVLVFISHSSEDKEEFIEPLVQDLEDCYIRVWIDKKRIVPGDNLRKSIFQDGIEKADIALIFFTKNSLKSSWVDREIKHVLRGESKKGNNFDLNKIISIFDSEETYKEIVKRYPELTDDLLHLMPKSYGKKELGQLISAIWSKYFTLQGGDIEIQRQLLAKEKEIFQKDKDLQSLKVKLDEVKANNSKTRLSEEFETIYNTGTLKDFIRQKTSILGSPYFKVENCSNRQEALAFGLIEFYKENRDVINVTEKGKEFFKWIIINKKS